MIESRRRSITRIIRVYFYPTWKKGSNFFQIFEIHFLKIYDIIIYIYKESKNVVKFVRERVTRDSWNSYLFIYPRRYRFARPRRWRVVEKPLSTFEQSSRNVVGEIIPRKTGLDLWVSQIASRGLQFCSSISWRAARNLTREGIDSRFESLIARFSSFSRAKRWILIFLSSLNERENAKRGVERRVEIRAREREESMIKLYG